VSEQTEQPKPKNLLQKLADAVAEIDNVDKRGRNEFQKYAYVKAADVAWMVRKALSARNIYLVSDVVEIRNYEIPAKEGHMQAVDVKVQFSFFDGDAPEIPPIVLHSYGTGTDKGDKAVYKAMTGALKYGLRHAFLIPDESDPEADETVDKATASANSKAVGERKVKEASERQGAKKDVSVLFYTYPDSHNGHAAQWLNISEFAAANEDKADSLRMIFTAHKAKKTADGGALVPFAEMGPLMEKLAGDLGLTVKELKGA
jgi:ERF superfamily protein